MASRWTSESVATDHRDLQANAMSVDWSGSNILLAGKKYVAVKNCNDPPETLRKFPRQSKYEVITAAWNPTANNQHYCALSSNQKVELLSWQGDDLSVVSCTKAHTRLITDLDWNKTDSNLLATSSVDTFVHVWDITDQRRPAISFSAIAGASRVQWNKISTHLLASAHEGDVRIWDRRRGSSPVQYITVYPSKIYGLDWSPTHEYQLAVCGQDCTVQFFDVTNAKRAESILQTPAPVWRARYTPFGEGLVTVVVPSSRRGENSLLLWNLSHHSKPVHTFVGNTDVVLEFEWRRQKYDSLDYQLITWSKDQNLRIWRIEPFLQKLCGHEVDDDDDGYFMSTNGADYNSFRPLSLDTGLPATEATMSQSLSDTNGFRYLEKGHTSPQSQPKSLEAELSMLRTTLHLAQTKLTPDILNRSCTIKTTVNNHYISLQVTFPPGYPYNAAPSFHIEDSSSADNLLKTKLLKVLKQTAQLRVRKNRFCLETCLSQLVATLEQTTQTEESDNNSLTKLSVLGPGLQPSLSIDSSTNIYGSVHDAYIPYPKTCGARFCGVGTLACFTRSSYTRRLSNRPDNTTPRSFSSLHGSRVSPQYQTGYSLSVSGVSDSGFFINDRNLAWSTSRGSRGAGPKTAKTINAKSVQVYDISKLLFIHRDLGENYVVDRADIVGMCNKNAEIAGSVGRSDLVQVWTIASLIVAPSCQSTDVEDDMPWSYHPLAKNLVEYLINYYAKISDVQTAAMLSCVFMSKKENKQNYLHRNTNCKSVSTTPGGSPYHTIHPADTSLEGWNYPTVKQNRSNSWSESLDDFKIMANIVEYREVVDNDVDRHCSLLDEKQFVVYDEYKKKYADILHSWNLLLVRTEMLKFLSTTTPSDVNSNNIGFYTECIRCKKINVGSAKCPTCRRQALKCSICRICVRGSSNICLTCGHGGHTRHMMEWFRTETMCPSGCGCECVLELNHGFIH